MAKDLTEQLARIGHKAELLATRYGTLLAQNRQLRLLLSERDDHIRRLEQKLEQANIEIKHLELAANLIPTRESLAQTRAFVSDLVREIDACVDDLVRDV